MLDSRIVKLMAALLDAPPTVQVDVANTLAAVPYGLRSPGEVLDIIDEKLIEYIPPIFLSR